MITLVTGYNNTGKTDWIANQLTQIVKNGHIGLLHRGFDLYKIEYKDDRIGYWEKPTLSNSRVDRTNYDLPFQTEMFKQHNTVIFIQPETELGHPSEHFKWVNHILHYKESNIYIETHSDHILNAIRIGVVSDQISYKDVKILFFKDTDDIVELGLNEKADLSEWLEGFFDQAENDYLEILKLKRNK